MIITKQSDTHLLELETLRKARQMTEGQLRERKLMPWDERVAIHKQITIWRKQEQELKDQILAKLPVRIEGFLACDVEEVDYADNERTMELTSYLGCPVFSRPDVIQYDEFADLTEIFRCNEGKYLRITIEEISPKTRCNFCEDRFKCYTARRIDAK